MMTIYPPTYLNRDIYMQTTMDCAQKRKEKEEREVYPNGEGKRGSMKRGGKQGPYGQ